MSTEPIDPAWEEYLSTGIDPTGGDLDTDAEDTDCESSDDDEVLSYQ